MCDNGPEMTPESQTPVVNGVDVPSEKPEEKNIQYKDALFAQMYHLIVRLEMTVEDLKRTMYKLQPGQFADPAFTNVPEPEVQSTTPNAE